MSNIEKAKKIIREAMDSVAKLGDLELVSKCPIVWFGDIEKYLEKNREDRVVVIGKNPSAAEYNLPNFKSEILGCNCSDECGSEFNKKSFEKYDKEALKEKLYRYNNSYFDNRHSDTSTNEGYYYEKWFGPIIADLEKLGIQYSNNEEINEMKYAIHIDFASPFAVENKKWSDLLKEQQDTLRKTSREHFSELFRLLDPSIVIFLGKFDEIPILLQQITSTTNEEVPFGMIKKPAYAMFDLSKFNFKLLFIRNGQNPGGKLREAAGVDAVKKFMN